MIDVKSARGIDEGASGKNEIFFQICKSVTKGHYIHSL